MLHQIAPYFGYLASILLALGLLVGNDLKFRWLNTGGNIAFITYGIILGAVPIILTNSILLCINLFWLHKIYNRKELFELLEFTNGGVMIDRFLLFYQKDIAAYFPHFKREELDGNINFVVLRDLVIANIFSAKRDTEGNAEVVLNYTVPKYRDYKIGPFIFEKEKDSLITKGIRRVYYTQVHNRHHLKFLIITGFKKEMIAGRECFAKNL